MTEQEIKEQILDVIARKESSGNYDNWDEYQFHLVANAAKVGKEVRLEIDRIIFMAMEEYATSKLSVQVKEEENAIKFAEWVWNEDFIKGIYSDGGKCWWSDKRKKSFTSAELLTEFNKS